MEFVGRRSALATALAAMVMVMAGCADIDRKEFNDLAYRLARVEKRMGAVDSRLEAGRKPYANVVADIASLRQQVARLRGMVQENSHGIDLLKRAKPKRDTGAQQKLEKRISRVEAHLGLTPSGAPLPSPGPKVSPPGPAPPKRTLSLDEEYKLGLRLFKRGSYMASRRSFQAYLNRKSRGRLAGHAHFWIGETYYKQGQYEEAILSYNQVIKRYRRSPKVPAALLKQGMAFQRMGDRRTARIVLNKLISRFPSSSEARTARRQLRRLR